MHLVSWASGIKEGHLEAVYRAAAEGPDPILNPNAEKDDDEMDEDEADETAEKDDCFNLLMDVQETVKEYRENKDPEEGGRIFEESSVLTPEQEFEKDIGDIPDKEAISQVLRACDPDEPFECDNFKNAGKDGPSHLPATLLEATHMKGDIWNRLLRLVIKLRSDVGGADTGFVRNARSARRASKDLNWHQCLVVSDGEALLIFMVSTLLIITLVYSSNSSIAIGSITVVLYAKYIKIHIWSYLQV